MEKLLSFFLLREKHRKGAKRRNFIAVLLAAMLSAGLFCFSNNSYADNNFQLISAVLEGPVLTDRIQHTSMSFTRDSVAYTSDGNQVAPGTPRFEKMVILNRPDYTLVQPFNAENIVVLAHYNGYFWGAQPWTYDKSGVSLYRSSDATNWESVFTMNPNRKISSLYVTESNNLLAGTHDWGPDGGIYVWDPNSQTLVHSFTMLTPNAYAEHWSWGELNGVIYVGEYGSKDAPDNGRRIYQSFNGGWNWETLYDPPAMNSYHVHKVLGDLYRSHLYWSHGDGYGPGPPDPELFRSADGGQSWQLLSRAEQPTAGIARPEGTYWGSDSGGEGIYRFLGGSEKGEFVCKDLVDSTGYMWDMREFNDVIYATSSVRNYGGNATVLVSEDGEHWGSLYQWPYGIAGLERFSCDVNNTIYAVIESPVGKVTTIIFPEPAVRTSWGINLDTGMTNLLSNPRDSSFEGCLYSSWYNYSSGTATTSITNEQSHSGDNSLKVSNIFGGSSITVTSPYVWGIFPAGTEVSATVRLSGWNNMERLYLGIRDGTNWIGSPNTHDSYLRTGVGWSEATTDWRLTKNSNALCLTISTWSSRLGDVFYVDSAALAINQASISFQIGGQPRSKETLSHQIPFPDNWTDVLYWQPSYPLADADGSRVIKSWTTEDSNSWLQLVVDNEADFKLEEVKDGLTELLVSVASTEPLPGSLIRFAVVQDSDSIGLKVISPSGVFVGTGTRSTICPTKVFFGSTPQGTMHAGGLYSIGLVYNTALSDTQLSNLLTKIAEQSWPAGDDDLGDGNNMSFLDLAKFATNWLNQNCHDPDWCDNADLDMSGRVDFFDFAIFAENWCWTE